MNVRDDIDVGVATNTGPVRGANEDDFLLLEPEATPDVQALGRLFVVADGMGGVAGGAEASRIAVRALAAAFLDVAGGGAVERLSRGFHDAAREVYRASLSSPQLTDMGTTMTAIGLRDRYVVIGHVGDSRCVRLRDSELVQLTEDHAVAEPRHLLTRCLGAGRETEKVDLVEMAAEVGDVFALMSDGVWGVLDDAAIARRLRGAKAGQAAELLVEGAIEAGSTDNATALVVRILAEDLGAPRHIDLPSEEATLSLRARELKVTPPRWPWILLVSGLIAAGLAVMKLVFGLDPFAALS